MGYLYPSKKGWIKTSDFENRILKIKIGVDMDNRN